jgi:hypothetical protein
MERISFFSLVGTNSWIRINPTDPDQTPASYVRYPMRYLLNGTLPGGMSGREGRPREGGAASDGCGQHSAG